MAEGGGAVEGSLDHPDWERLRRNVPAGRLLPLLDAIARGESRQLHLAMDGTGGLCVNYQVNNTTQHND